MKLYKRMAAIAAAALMTVSLTACGDTSWVYKTNDDTVTSGVYLGYLTQAYLTGQSEEGFDSSIKNIWKQKIGDRSYKDYVSETAGESSKRYLAISKKFDELGLTLDDDDQAAIDANISVYWPYIESYYQPNGTSKESYEKMITSSRKESKIFNSYYGEGGSEEVSKEDLVKEMKEKYVDLNYFEMSFASDDGDAVLTSEEIEELKTKAEDYAARINSGESTFNEVKTEYTDEQAKAEAEKNDEEFTATDPDSISKDEDTKALFSKDDTSKSEDFVNAVFDDIETGKASVITVDTSYYVVVKYSLDDDLDGNLDQVRSSLLSELKGEDFENMVTEWINALEVDENTSSLHKYNPKNIEMPSSSN